MPLFGKKDKVVTAPTPPPRNGHSVTINHNNNNTNKSTSMPPSTLPRTESQLDGPRPEPVHKPKLVFHCQQAQGSPTGLISGFSNVKELYQKIADCYGFPAEDILFCTLNTHRIDMENLLSAQLCLEDFIFVHRKGTKKEVEVTKTDEALGLTITDNGTGYAFIKRIREGSVIDNAKVIQIGDHIEKIDGETLVGWRHVDVAKYLKGIPIGKTFTMRLIEPLRAGFVNIGSNKSGKQVKSAKINNGKQTLRFPRSGGPARIEDAPDDCTQLAVEKINGLLESFMGINDVDLATQVWEMAEGRANTMDFAEALDNSELESFGFTDDFVIEVWGIVTDAKSGRLVSSVSEDAEDLSHLVTGRRSRLK